MNKQQQSTFTDIDLSVRGYYQRVIVTKKDAINIIRIAADNNIRPLTYGKVEMYKKLIEDKHLTYSPGLCIRFDLKELLCDGQTRLNGLAITESDDNFIVVDIATQITPEEQAVIDRNNPRTPANILTGVLREDMENPPSRTRIKLITSIGKAAAIYDSTVTYDKDKVALVTAIAPPGSVILTDDDLFRYIQEHWSELEVAAAYVDRTRPKGSPQPLLSPTVEGLLMVMFNRIDPQATIEFFSHFNTGSNLPDKSPFLLLRSKLQASIGVRQNNQKKLSKVHTAVYVTKVWKAIRKNRDLDGLKYQAKEKVTIDGLPKPIGWVPTLGHSGYDTMSKTKAVRAANQAA